MKLKLSVNNLLVIRWYVDASAFIQIDMKGHTGGMLTLSKGAVSSKTVKQKVNTDSSTISKLIGTHDMIPEILWTKYFVEAQGYKVDHNIVIQDSKSDIRLMVNGIFSSGPKTNHIKVKYFLATDLIKYGEIELEYFSAELMGADVLNKPKQGKDFCIDCIQLMNVPVDYDDEVKQKRTNPRLLPRPGKPPAEVICQNTYLRRQRFDAGVC